MLRSSYSPNLPHELKAMSHLSPRTSVVGSGILLGQNAFEAKVKGAHFFIFRWIRAPILSGCMLWVPFLESRVFSIGLTKYQEF